tara:strand:+ start:2574 stop:3566 length:993 start_codon:yes stop_codon:yes gene_type:complete
MVCGLLALGGLYLEARDFLDQPPSEEEQERILVIERGSGPQAVSRLLADNGVVRDADYFTLYLRYRKAASQLRAGQFRFSTGMLPEQVLEVLVSAREVTWPVTFPEGLRIEEMARRVEAAGFGSASAYSSLARDPQFIASLDLGMEPPPPTLEGILIPNTYALRSGTTERQVIEAQVQRFRQLWDERRRARAAELGMSPYEVMVLASVVEKETGRADERPHIASVFHNRLQKNMRLESDPTIIYGLEDYDGDIRKRDIRKPHPWNTYVIRGLPPTPIAGAGVAAIDAVLWPLQTKDLFFVSRNDGSHHFSETYAEHARMVNRYQRRRRGR